MTNLKFRAIISKDTIVHFTLADLCNNNRFINRELLRPWLAAGNQPDIWIDRKDDNGVETYSGDIIKVMNWGESAGEILGYTTIVWDLDDQGWRYEDYCLVESHYYQFRTFEVIGNKTLNPELLESLGEK